jgi:hypothetical protein
MLSIQNPVFFIEVKRSDSYNFFIEQKMNAVPQTKGLVAQMDRLI